MIDARAPRIEVKVHFARGRRGRKRAAVGGKPPAAPMRLPRVTKLMALAIRFDQLIGDGEVQDYADIARLGHVTRARVTQIMNLLLLAPDIQKAILELPPVAVGDDPIGERQLRPMAGIVDWRRQRAVWRRLAAIAVP